MMAAPVVTSVVPPSGPQAGGTAVTITGVGFTDASAVMFGSEAATSVVVVSDTEITAVTPPSASPMTGAVSVAVTTPEGTGSAYVFAYLAPPPLIVFPADASAADFEATPPMPIDPGGNVSPWPPVPTFGTVIPGEPREKTAGNNPYVLALPTFRGPPLIPVGTTFNQSAHPPFGATGFPWNATNPASLPFNRTPPFPAYPT